MSIDIIKSKLSLVEYVGRYVRLIHKGHGKYVGLCPFHSEKTASFSINEEKNMFYCFGCHKHGDLITFAQEIHKWDFKDAVKQLSEELGISMESSFKIDENMLLYSKLKAFVSEAHKILLTNSVALNYLYSRGIQKETIDQYLLGYVTYDLVSDFTDRTLGINGALRDRVLFPISFKGKIVGFGARALDNRMPKYINSADSDIFSKRNILYGLQKTRLGVSMIDKGKAIDWKVQANVLVEGYVDVLIVNQNTPYQAFASLGTAVSIEQLTMLLKKPLILCFDGDVAGKNACLKTIEMILGVFAPGMMVKVFSVDSDPAEMILLNKEQFQPEYAPDLSDFVFNMIFSTDQMSGISSELLLYKQEELKKWLRFIVNIQVRKVFGAQWEMAYQKLLIDVKKSFKNVNKMNQNVNKMNQNVNKMNQNDSKSMQNVNKTNFNMMNVVSQNFHNQQQFCTLPKIVSYQAQLLAMIVQNPELIDHVEEEVANLPCDSDMEIFKRAILERQYKHLYLTQVYSKIYVENTSLENWMCLYRQFMHKQQELEISLLKKELAQNFSQQVWMKIQMLQSMQDRCKDD